MASATVQASEPLVVMRLTLCCPAVSRLSSLLIVFSLIMIVSGLPDVRAEEAVVEVPEKHSEAARAVIDAPEAPAAVAGNDEGASEVASASTSVAAEGERQVSVEEPDGEKSAIAVGEVDAVDAEADAQTTAGVVAVLGDDRAVSRGGLRETLAAWNESIEAFMSPIAHWSGKIFFVGPVVDKVDGTLITDRRDQPITLWYVVIWLGLAGVILTLRFGFLNIRCLPLALRTVAGKYSSPGDPGEITHFQALSAALSGTVGLGNIAGVAVAISIGGPGAVFWMFVAGVLGMTTKFCECTLGIRYRRLRPNGTVLGGPMYYLAAGFKERQMVGLGRFLAISFAIFCAIAAIGAGNLFQVNQSLDQLVRSTGMENSYFATADGEVVFGLVLAVLVGLVVILGIKAIGKVAAILVPVMCGVYVAGCAVVLISNFAAIPAAFQTIWQEAFRPEAGVGGILIAILMGFRRAAFSNEAGFGSASIAHSAVKTKYPASEGLVALLEPFVDTVIVCSMTALVIITTGEWAKAPEGLGSWGEGIQLTSRAFETVMPWFKYVLTAAAITFAISTLITWSYYGEQAWCYLFGGSQVMGYVYRIVFVGFVVAGAVMSLDAVVNFADGPFFALCLINLLGVYALLPVIREELAKFLEFTRKVDRGEMIIEHAIELGGRNAPKIDVDELDRFEKKMAPAAEPAEVAPDHSRFQGPAVKSGDGAATDDTKGGQAEAEHGKGS
jgi:AGCS family alanine or glycine:cation symporter